MASRILLADDSITIQKVVNLTFADEGIEVVAVSNGDLAERRLTEVRPDLVLADIFMPGKNGYELCEAIKEHSQFRNVPVVLLVGAFEPFDQTEAKRVKADAHLTKPFESRTLVETVRRLISATPRSASGPLAAPVPAESPRVSPAPSPVAAASSVPTSLPGKLDFSAMMPETSSAPDAAPQRNTGELASPPLEGDVLDLGFSDTMAVESVHATVHNESDQPLEPMVFSSNGDSSVGHNSADMVQDFDTTQPFDDAAHDPISFETEPDSGSDGHSNANNGQDWFGSSGFANTKSDAPSDGAAWHSSPSGSLAGFQSPTFAPESSETAVATMLAVDEPLGDVLFDESETMGGLSYAAEESHDSPGLELTEPEMEAPVVDAGAHFDLVESKVDSAPEHSFEIHEGSVAEVAPAVEPHTAIVDEPAVEMVVPDTTEPAHEFVAVDESTETSSSEMNSQVSTSFEVSSEPVIALGSPESPAEPAPEETATFEHSASSKSNDSHEPSTLDWTSPHAGSFSTAQLDSVVMPIGADEYIPQKAQVAEEPATESDETAFKPMWTEEETRFTPIDIEAVAIEDTASEEKAPVETGFAFSTLPADEPVSHVSAPVVEEQPQVVSESEVVSEPEVVSQPAPLMSEASEAPAVPVVESAVPTETTTTVTLSPEAIDEIVRRVIAELSESVVREIAWEVVPDCVERVVDQLTRESLEKHN
jgi:CheY-like chemotaxis protein